MKIYEIDRLVVRCFVFICVVNILLSLMKLQMSIPTTSQAASSTILQLTTMVCVYGLMANAYGVSTTRGAERIFSVMLGIIFLLMLNIEARSQFLGFGVVSIRSLGLVAILIVLVARADPQQTALCAQQLRKFAFSRNSILFAVALLVYLVARIMERAESYAPGADWLWLLHQASLMSVMVLFLYAACPYIKSHANR